ncbi:MAG TPA: sugar phosphate isomerase/epimerase family protein [Planctomycetota bacterium]|nr:sugar phosphate isomerase/epimerase family protein [Planctomycetota bacterium]
MFKNFNPHAIGHRATFEQTVQLARQFGFAGVDLDLPFIREKGVEAAGDLLEKHNLRVGAFSLSVKWRDADSDRDFADSLEQFVRDAKAAAALGSTRCLTWVMPCSDVLDYRDHFILFVSRMRTVAQILKGFGQSLGLEFIGPKTLRVSRKHGFIYTMDGMRAAACAIGTGNVGFLLDSFHWYCAQADSTDILDLNADEVVAVHLNDAVPGVDPKKQLDNQRELPGVGVIQLNEFLAALKKIGYTGPLTVEPFNQRVRELPLTDAVKLVAESLDKLTI